MTGEKPLGAATRLIGAARQPHDHHGSVNPPVYRASTILKPDMAAWRETERPNYSGYRYGLSATPSSRGFEQAMAETYGAAFCVAVPSGLAMITATILALTKAGDDILVTDSAYNPTRQFCDTTLKRFGVATRYYDPMIGAGIADLMTDRTTLVITESPGSLTFEVQDVPAITAAAHAKGALVMIDNTWATALGYNPFAHGVDIVTEAVTKFVGGHSDLLMGAILGTETLGRRIWSTAKGLGFCCGGDDLYLAQRGLRTLALRLDRSAATAMAVAAHLAGKPEVARLLHPAFPSCPGHAVWARDFALAPGLFSIVLRPMARAQADGFIDRLRLFGIGASWGGYESLVLPADPRPIRTAVPWRETGPLVRFYTGLEDADDLIADLDQAWPALTG